MISFLSDSYRKVKETQRKSEVWIFISTCSNFQETNEKNVACTVELRMCEGGEKGEEGGSLFFATVKMAAFFGGQ